MARAVEYVTASSHSSEARSDSGRNVRPSQGSRGDLEWSQIRWGQLTERNRQHIRRGVVDKNSTEGPLFGGFSGVTRGGQTAPCDTIQEGDTRVKKNCGLNLERTLVKRRGKVGVVTRRQLKRSSLFITLQLCWGRLVKRSYFSGKRVTPSVVAQGDTNPSDATGWIYYSRLALVLVVHNTSITCDILW